MSIGTQLKATYAARGNQAEGACAARLPAWWFHFACMACLTLNCLMIVRKVRVSAGVNMAMAVPVLPALPVRPHLQQTTPLQADVLEPWHLSTQPSYCCCCCCCCCCWYFRCCLHLHLLLELQSRAH